MKALVIGSTGATGIELTKQLIEQEEFTEIHVFVRNIPTINHPKLNVHKVDFNEVDIWSEKLKGDVLFLAMGTTLKTCYFINGFKNNYVLITHWNLVLLLTSLEEHTMHSGNA